MKKPEFDAWGYRTSIAFFDSFFNIRFASCSSVDFLKNRVTFKWKIRDAIVLKVVIWLLLFYWLVSKSSIPSSFRQLIRICLKIGSWFYHWTAVSFNKDDCSGEVLLVLLMLFRTNLGRDDWKAKKSTDIVRISF